MPVAHRETVESQGVEAVLLDVGDGHVELLRPLGPDTPVGKYLAKKGPGLHHVAYAVPDIDETLGKLKEAGVELIDSEAREGIRDSRVAFVHPKATGGVLTEIVRAGGGPLMAAAERVSIGFSGGQVVEVKLTAAKLKELRKALDKPEGWADIETEDGALAIDLGQVVFLRHAGGRTRASASPAERSAMRWAEAAAPAGGRGRGRGRAPLWWRKNPSACPYSQRFWVRRRTRSSPASGCAR